MVQRQTAIENENDSEDSEKEQQGSRTNLIQDSSTTQQKELNEDTTETNDRNYEPNRSKDKKQITEEVIHDFRQSFSFIGLTDE